MINIRLEVSPLASSNLTGVGYYTKLLAEALNKNKDINLELTNFNFLKRQPSPKISGSIVSKENYLIPLRIYSKLHSHGISFPFDIAKKPVDLTIFTNYATWPTLNSKLSAVAVHDLTFLHYPDAVEEKNLAHLKRIVPKSLKKADIILTVSNTVKKEIVKEFNIDPKKIVVTTIPAGSLFSTTNPTNMFKKYNIKTKKYIYTLGTIEPRKDIPTLIEAYLLLPDALRKEYSLVIAGGMGWKSEESKKSIENAITKGENIKYLGYIDQKDSNALHQQASLHVSASLYEGFGMPILESITSNTMAVLSDTPVYREVGGDISVYANPKDSVDFSKKIEYALTNKEHKKYFNKNRKRHLEGFSWTKNVNNILEKI